jgi:acyl-coenzyme A thioesterase PaaI-like protein
MSIIAAPLPPVSNTATVLKQWLSLDRLPLGRRLFNFLIGVTVPYAASIGAAVTELSPGYALVRMADRRKVRNHLRSVHAVALTNLAELTGNLALMSRQPAKGARWIVTGFDSEYLKKARGTITARCEISPLDWSAPQYLEGRVELRDAAGDLVMLAKPRWKIGPA